MTESLDKASQVCVRVDLDIWEHMPSKAKPRMRSVAHRSTFSDLEDRDKQEVVGNCRVEDCSGR